jgi:hypothetical protein
MEITYGNRSGRWYREGAIEHTVTPLANRIIEIIPGVSDVNIFYDDEQDFYHCRFKAGGKQFDVRYYKVFSVNIDGEDKWQGCPTYQSWEFVLYLKRHALGEAKSE